GLIHHTNVHEMLLRIETTGAGALEVGEERLVPALTPDNIRQDMRLLQVQNHDGGRAPYTMRKRRPRLLVRRFAVHHYCVATSADLRASIQDFLDKLHGDVGGV